MPPVPRFSLVARTVDTLGRSIVQGGYPTDTLLPPEGEIGRLLGVGRNVVREAIKLLSAKGLVRVAQGAGTPVLPESEWDYFDQQVIGWSLESDLLRDRLVDELSAVRFVVEPAIAAMAAEGATTTEVLRLFEAYERMEAELGNRDREVEADILFHRRLFEASHNRLMMGFLRTVVAVLRSNFELAIKADHVIIRYLKEHRDVAEAVRRRDPDGAHAAMRELLLNNRNNLAEMRAKTSRAARSPEGTGT